MGYPPGGLKHGREEEDEEEHADAPPPASRPRIDPTPAAAPARRVRPLGPGSAEADRYLNAMQREFADKPDKSDEFRAILLDYHHMSIDVAGVVERMQALLNGYPDLIRGFNAFLPRGYALKVDDDQQGGGAGDA
ncbi:unnamed protein product [Urochloa decumbens]|uniref:PAH2 domain-containing protein n=1 Tax=Urochloa decumbens TaxID=240449 RepID=A0ABC9BZY1_9POAL